MTENYDEDGSKHWRAFVFVSASLVLFGYGAYGVWIDDLHVPTGKYSPGIHLHGTPAWLMFSAVICACVVMLTYVAYHYNKHANDERYIAFGAVWSILAGGLALVSILWQLA